MGKSSNTILTLVFTILFVIDSYCQDTLTPKAILKNSDLKPYWETMMSLPHSKGKDNKDLLFLELINQHPDASTKEKLLEKYFASRKHKRLSNWIIFVGPCVSFVPVIGTAPFVTGMHDPYFGIPTQAGFEYAMIGVSIGAVVRIASFATAIINRNKRRHEELEMELIWNNYIKSRK